MKTKPIRSAFFAVAVFLTASLPLFADDAADRKTAADMNRHGFELFRHLSEKDSKENAFISPYSIDSAFGLVYCGAKDRTAEEIRSTLGLPANPEKCGEFFHAVSQEYAANKTVEVLVSNSVWYEQKYEKDILPSFIDMIGKYYGGTFYKENFKKPVPLVSKINAYVEDHTKSMIKDLLSPSDITDKTFMILLNTLFFEAKWKTPFKKADTKPMVFRNFDGTEKRVKMMYRRGFDISYYSNEEDNVHAVVLPYEDPRFDLIALMPARPGADRGEAALKDIVAKIGDKLDVWLSNRSPYETRLWLPIVDLTCRYSLKDALGELGMKTPFLETQANFHGIAEPPKDRPPREDDLVYIWIEKVIHKTALKMDEEKTQAAAATAIIMGGFGGAANAQPPPVNIFRADRPYLVLIRDNKTGLILFAGRINDPGVEATEEDGPAAPSFDGMPFGLPPSGPGASFPGAAIPRGAVPGPGTQSIPRQATTSTRGAATQAGEPAATKVDGQISVILEGYIDGEDAFVFRDGKVFLEHKSFKMPAEITVNGKPWEDPDTPFELGFTPAPAETRFVCEGRGRASSRLTRTADSVAVSVCDEDGAAARYRFILFQPSGVKEPLDPPKEPVGNTVKEVPAGTKPAATLQTVRSGTASDIFAGVPLWDKERDGQPEIRLRELVDEAAKRAEADLKTLSAVRTTSFDAEHSYADIDFIVVDQYGKIIRFIDEIEQQTPRLSWRRVEIRVEPAGGRFAGDKPKADAPPASDVRQYRLTGQIRVITYTPAKKETPQTTGDSASSAERVKEEPVYFGETDFLAKLYDLSLALPEEALATGLRFNEGKCDLSIQMRERNIDLSRCLRFSYWQIARLQQRIVSDDICVFNITLSPVGFYGESAGEDDPARPQQDGVPRTNKVETIAALNIFDPDRTPETTAVRQTADSRATALERQLDEALIHRAEFASLLETLQQMQGGLTKEQTEQIRLHIEACDQRIERLQKQLKALRP